MNIPYQLPLMYQQLLLLIVLVLDSEETKPGELVFNNDGTKNVSDG